MYNSVGFSIFTSCATITIINLEHLITFERNPIYLNCHPPILETNDMWSFVSGFLNLASCFHGSFHTRYQYFFPFSCQVMFHCMDIPNTLFTHQMMDICVISTFLAVMNSAVMNNLVQVFLWTYVFTSMEYIPRSEIVGSHGNSV